MYPTVELQKRVASFQQVLRVKAVDGALLAQLADRLYFTGTAQNTHVYIPAEGSPVVFAYRDAERAAKECPWEVLPLAGISKLPQQIYDAGLPLPKVLGLEYDVLPVMFFERYQKAFTGVQFTDISYPLRLLRAIKSPWEIEQIEKGCAIYAELLKYAPTVLRPGMSEVEFESLLEMKARLLGHEPVTRLRNFGSTIHFAAVVSGARAAMPSYFDGPVGGPGVSPACPLGASLSPIQPGEPIVVDIGLVVNGYYADVTRMFVCGDLPAKFQTAYDAALAVEEQIRRSLVPGRAAGDIYAEALAWVEKETPFAANFMGFGSSRVRFVGHGLGLELDELPTISQGAKEILQPGMVIAVEPKFIFPGEGAIGIENSFAVEGANGARCLSALPKEIVRV